MRVSLPRWNWTFAPIAAMVMAGVLLAISVGIAIFAERSYVRQELEETGAQAGILAASVAPALAFQDDETARDYVNAMAANPTIEAAGVYNNLGNPVAVYTRSGNEPPPASLTLDGSDFRDGKVVVSRRAEYGGTQLGFVYLRVSAEPPARRVARYAGIGLLVVMGALVVAVLAGAHAALGRANNQLRARAEELSATNKSLHVEIAEREKAEDALRQSQKMEAIGQLTGGVAHDFNNLLAALMSGLRILENQQDPEKRKSITDMMNQTLERGARLTRQLLAFARRQSLNPEVIDPAQQIESMRELLQRSLREDIRIETDFPPDLWPVEVDPGQFELVILNLAVNARDAMPDGGVLTISAGNVDEADKPFVRISVSDTGRGMSPELIARAFEPFFTTKEVGKGTGLGLPQVYGFAAQSGGYADIESVEDAGTTVTLHLPRSMREPATSEAAPAGVALDLPPANGAKVLVVEDDDSVAAFVCDLLKQFDYQPHRVASASEALEAVRTRPLDLVFSDIIMPGGMNGLDLSREIRRRRPDLPVVLTTGYSGVADPVQQEFPVLAKPYQPGELDHVLRQALEDAAG